MVALVDVPIVLSSMFFQLLMAPLNLQYRFVVTVVLLIGVVIGLLSFCFTSY